MDIYSGLGLALNSASSFNIIMPLINKCYESFAGMILIQSFHANNFYGQQLAS